MLALPCCRRCGSLGCGDKGAEGAFATGSKGPSLASFVAVRGGGGGLREACPLWTWWPSAAAVCDPGVGIDAAARRGYSRPLRCG